MLLRWSLWDPEEITGRHPYLLKPDSVCHHSPFRSMKTDRASACPASQRCSRRYLTLPTFLHLLHLRSFLGQPIFLPFPFPSFFAAERKNPVVGRTGRVPVPSGQEGCVLNASVLTKPKGRRESNVREVICLLFRGTIFTLISEASESWPR